MTRLESFRKLFSYFLEQTLSSTNITINTKWDQDGKTVAGGNGKGVRLNRFSHPRGIYVDDDNQCIYVADCENHRVVQWKYGAKSGQVVAGGNCQGNRTDQLNGPTGVTIDKRNNSLIISDTGNRRVVRWSLQNGANGEILISDIDCNGVIVDNNGNIYVSDWKKDEVRRWKIGERQGTIVAGGNGKGAELNQFNGPTYMFVDDDKSVYVSDCRNNRVMKWVKGAKEGIIVAGGHGEGNSLRHLSNPMGVIVDHSGNVYVADSANHRVVCWSKEASQGRIVFGGNGRGNEPNQFNYLRGLSFDRHGNLYVVDTNNDRVQRFDVDSN